MSAVGDFSHSTIKIAWSTSLDHCVPVKNITVSVDDGLYHLARVKAAERRTSVSALVRGYLQTVVQEESEFERLRREEQELRARLRAKGGGFSAEDRLPREQIYDR